MNEENMSNASQPTKKRSKKPIILGIIIVAIALVGIGMMIWHEQPSFCSTMCHIESTYVQNYSQEQAFNG